MLVNNFYALSRQFFEFFHCTWLSGLDRRATSGTKIATIFRCDALVNLLSYQNILQNCVHFFEFQIQLLLIIQIQCHKLDDSHSWVTECVIFIFLSTLIHRCQGIAKGMLISVPIPPFLLRSRRRRLGLGFTLTLEGQQLQCLASGQY